MKKIKVLVLVLLLNIAVSLNSNDVFAADESVIMFKGVNATCNVYTKSTGGELLTYINPLFQRDAPLLGSSTNYYKTMVSGVEGWIAKSSPCIKGSTIKKVSKMPQFTYSNGGKALKGLDVSRYQAVGSKLYYNSVYNTGYITINMGYTDLPAGLKNNTIYYSYDGNYYYTNYNTMVANYKAKHRKNAVNANNPYYDYYQYLPIRSVSKINGANLDKRLVQVQSNAANKLKETKKFSYNCNGKKGSFTSNYNGYYSNTYKQGNSFVSKQNGFQVNSGALYGIMLNESANGISNLSRHYNNPFGWGAVDSCPNSATRYKNMPAAIDQYYKNMSTSYANPINASGGKGTQLGNKQAGANVRYASDSNWGYKNAYNYRKLDEAAGKVDKNKYKIGILKSGKSATDGKLSNEKIPVYNSASTSAKSPYYYERNGSSVIIQGTSGSFYKVQKDSAANSGSVYIPKSKIHVANTAVAPTPAPTPVSYQKSGNTHYIWGLNTSGQLGNGKTTNITQANKINLASVLPKGQTIKQVVYNNNNIHVLSTQGNVYSSGKNTYGQRGFNSKANVFTKTNPLNDPIASINLAGSGNLLRMCRTKLMNEYYFVGQNGFNAATKKFNRTTKYPVRVRYSNGKQISANYLNYNLSKVSGTYFYSGNYVTRSYSFTYNTKTKKMKQRTYNKYSKGKRTYHQRLKYDAKEKISHKMEYYYVNTKLRSVGKKKAKRLSTYYKKGKATTTYQRYYSNKGKLQAAKRIAVRK